MITPAQIKTIASAIRAEEEKRLDKKLSQTTVLNTVTRALGLAPNFAALVSATTPKDEATKEPPFLSLHLVLDHVPSIARFDAPKWFGSILPHLSSPAWKVNALPSIGYVLPFHFWIDAPGAAPGGPIPKPLAEDISRIVSLLGEHLKSIDCDVMMVRAEAIADPSDQLLVDFVYLDNHQPASAGAIRQIWDALTAKFSEEEAVLMHHLDIDIPEYIGTESVVVVCVAPEERQSA